MIDFKATALGVIALSLASCTTPASSFSADAPQIEGGQCRRAAPALVLPPEVEETRNQQAEDRLRAPSPIPPPPPAMAPPAAAMAESSDGRDAVVVTGSRVVGEGAPPGSAFEFREPGQPPAKAGLLTAGDYDDRLNPDLYAGYVDRFLKREPLKGVPRVDTRQVLEFVVQDNRGRPVPFADVTLTCSDGNTLTLQSTADGAAVFFPELDRLGDSVRVAVKPSNGRSQGARTISVSPGAGAQRHTITVDRTAQAIKKFDLALVVDATGSMGDEMEYLKSELLSILSDINKDHPTLDIQVALVVYRDKGDEYITRTFKFTGDTTALQADLARQSAGGGGDYPEAVEQAMARALALDWREDAVRSILLVADAPPHADDIEATWRSAEAARAKRIHIVPVGASGVADGAEYMMRAMAVVTQSRYIFLTDDSGIGNPHATPAVDCYDVTLLGPLIRRVLDSQVSGRRVGPRDGEIIRTVGRHDNGKCIIPAEALR